VSVQSLGTMSASGYEGGGATTNNQPPAQEAPQSTYTLKNILSHVF